MALGNYQDLDGYLATQHRNTGHPTVLPGALDSAREGYGVYVGDEISGQAALARSARDVANSRVALNDAMEDVSSYRDFQNQEEIREYEMEKLRAENVQNTVESETARAIILQAEYPELFSAIEEGRARSNIRKAERRIFNAENKVAKFAMFSELFDSGQVSPQTIAEYNESVANNPEKAQLSSFVKDPETGELYGISTKGEYIPFTSTEDLDDWVVFNPDAKDWALSAYPEPDRSSKRREWREKEIRARALVDAGKAEQKRAQEAAKTELYMLNIFIEQADADIKNLHKQLEEGLYSTEEERVELETRISRAEAQRTLYVRKAQSVYDPSLSLQGPADGKRAEDAARFQAAQQAAQGINVGGGGAKSWRDIGNNKPQQ